MMLRAITYMGIGYLSGSVLYARLFGRIFKKDVLSESADQNPGTFNAFQYGGVMCGILTLLGDVLKGFFPIYYFVNGSLENMGLQLAFVLAAPVFGHVLPIFYGFHGGKGIAVSFGCLLGLLPDYQPVLILAFFFLLFSLVFRITPNYHRTLATYLFAVIGMNLVVPVRAVSIGFTLVAGLIMLKLLLSSEEKERCKVEVIWKH
jgi:glycerol-3-phosphate acyltransferase PlsY